MLKYHQFRGRLGMGDLHPGGAAASTQILRQLSARGVRRVLEVGAGIGNTAARMCALGWDVTALEPDRVLFARLSRSLGERARCEGFLSHSGVAPYDAIVAESVFCLLELSLVLAHARELLRPGGYLAFVEAVWTDTVSPAQSREWHDRTLRLFGIPMGSRECITWQDWRQRLKEFGFRTEYEERLPRGSAGHPPSRKRRSSITAVLSDPRLALWAARYRLRKRAAEIPRGVLESWIFVGRTPDALH